MESSMIRDILRRRLRFLLRNDPTSMVFADIKNPTSIHVTVVLNDDFDPSTLTGLGLKYKRALEDLNMFKVTVLNKTNHYHRKPDTMLVWSKKGGFT